jgi:opacity protein-like surface antigen
MVARVPTATLFDGRRPAGGIFAPGGPSVERGSTGLATFGLRYDLPSQVGRFQPYVTGGIGIACTETSVFAPRSIGIIAGPGFNAPLRPEADGNVDVTHTGLASSAGVGASVRIFKQLSADLDARYFRLDHGRNLGRFGGGLSYRF